MKVAIITANLGNYDPSVDPVEQDIPMVFRRITDKDFPLRSKSMTPRLQARIVKMHMWQFLPDHDYYLWVDSSCTLPRSDSLKWFLDQLGTKNIAVFKHPHRNTIQEEADYLKGRIEFEKAGKKPLYILPRYENELIDEQLAEVDPSQELYAPTAFIFKDSPPVRHAMKQWWYHTSRYHSIDKLSFPHVLAQAGLAVKVIPDNYLKIPYLQYVRK